MKHIVRILFMLGTVAVLGLAAFPTSAEAQLSPIANACGAPGSVTVSTPTVDLTDQVTITVKLGRTDLTGVVVALYNSDNIVGGTPKIISVPDSNKQGTYKDLVKSVVPAPGATTASVTFGWGELYRPDHNWGDKPPKTIQINAGFTRGTEWSGFYPNCVYSGLKVVARPALCAGSSISSSQMTESSPVKITMNATQGTSVRSFVYALYNLDNPDPINHTPRAIKFADGTSVISQAGTSGISSNTLSLAYQNINKVDLNTNKKPINIQVNGYFVDAVTGATSAPQAPCVQSFHVVTTVPICTNMKLSSNVLLPDQPINITMTSSTNNVSNFTYAFYNSDNLANPADERTKKSIQFVAGQNYVRSGANTANPNTIQITYAEFNKPDKNFGGKYPVNAQVNGYFSTTDGQSSAGTAACALPFTIPNNGVATPPASPPETPTPDVTYTLNSDCDGVATTLTAVNDTFSQKKYKAVVLDANKKEVANALSLSVASTSVKFDKWSTVLKIGKYTVDVVGLDTNNNPVGNHIVVPFNLTKCNTCDANKVDIMVSLDRSGSMTNKESDGRTKLTWAKEAIVGNISKGILGLVGAFAETPVGLKGNVRMGIDTFGSCNSSTQKISLDQPLTSEMALFTSVVNKIAFKGTGTCIQGGISLGNAQLATSTANKKIHLLLSDGKSSQVLPGTTTKPNQAAIDEANKVKPGIEFFVLGYGDVSKGEINETTLKAIASGADHYRYRPNTQEWASTISGFEEQICPNVKTSARVTLASTKKIASTNGGFFNSIARFISRLFNQDSSYASEN